MKENNNDNNENDAGGVVVDIYYINLKRRPDRDLNIQQEFQRVGLLEASQKYRIHRFDAIDGLSHTLSEEEKSWFIRFDANKEIDHHNTNLLKANSLSHMGVWKQFLQEESNAEVAIVFQDDVQLHNDFLHHMPLILQHNPQDAIITWIGCNGYASGQVSRSAPLDMNSYNPDQVSLAIPSTAGIIGKCRKGLIATNSLAYVLTKAGARQLLEYFTTDGWDHHTDHALVEYLDIRDVSYISRQIVATTMDDGILGSDIFIPQADESKALTRCVRLVQQALYQSVVLKLSRNQAISIQQSQHDESLVNDMKSDENTPSWLQNIDIRCEPMSCYFPDCKSPIITYVYLNFPTTTSDKEDETCQTNENDDDDDGGSKTTTCSSTSASELLEEENYYELDPSGVRRSKKRKKFVVHMAPPDITFEEIANIIPAYWILEQWAIHQKWDLPPSTIWPKFAATTPTTPLKDIQVVEVEIDGKWHSAKIIATGYRDDSFPLNVYATYVVQLQRDPTKFIPIVDENRIREQQQKKTKKKKTEL